MTRWHAVVLSLAIAAASSCRAAAQTLPTGYAGSDTCKVCHEDIYNGFKPRARITSGGRRQARLAGPLLRVLSRRRLKPTPRDPRPITSAIRPSSRSGGRQDLSHVSSEPADPGRPPGKQPRPQSDCVHGLPQSACERSAAGGSQSGGHQYAVRKLSLKRVGPIPAAVPSQTTRRRHELRGLPQSRMAAFGPRCSRTSRANDPGCFKCHGDKRGPFTFEHAPVRFEGCQACHEPHGSANPRMLTRAKVRFVCLECHANLPTVQAKVAGVVPPAFHDLRRPQFQNCTVCHQKIHGSHVDRNLLKMKTLFAILRSVAGVGAAAGHDPSAGHASTRRACARHDPVRPPRLPRPPRAAMQRHQFPPQNPHSPAGSTSAISSSPANRWKLRMRIAASSILRSGPKFLGTDFTLVDPKHRWFDHDSGARRQLGRRAVVVACIWKPRSPASTISTPTIAISRTSISCPPTPIR